ncbi:hypothetical protein BN946_scf184775.g16 [Trametes cinnabarina]|uniref:Ribonuclease H2 subunit B n=1 Tax=Pycnoporus cinnabarinus TaxID=5643 RepID=A0A060ST88_PYCCI|nr:hypothetical protein BN946_scf184775.g16 [Trametes cinnabarina]
MAIHFGVLPDDLVQALSGHLASDVNSSQQDIRVLRLPHPRTGVPSLFIPHETSKISSILEVHAVSPPNKRSWFTEDSVVEDGKLLVMTPIDPAFLLIPLLETTIPAEGMTANFRPADDVLEEAASKIVQPPTSASDDFISSEDVSYLSSLRCVQAVMRRVCEYKDITPEITVFRYSPDKVQIYLRSKVSRLSDQSISEVSRTMSRNLAKDGLFEDGKEELLAGEYSMATATSIVTDIFCTAARIRAACDLLSQYLPRTVFDKLLSSYDLASLDAYVKGLREEAMALSAVNMNAVEAKESKDLKDAGNDKKRKAKGSHGVEKLKKANVKGMAKLSSFFHKK